jgi:tetratricopeptide (TPR) repeat protein
MGADGAASTPPEERMPPIRAAVLVAGLLILLFVLFIYVYGAVGPAWAAGLAQRIGELHAAEAQRLAEAGFTEDAIARYRQAFDSRFDDPNQRVWRAQEFARLLMEEGRAGEAAEVAAGALAAGRFQGKSHSLLNAALRRKGAYGEAAEAARVWAEWAAREGHAGGVAWALYYRGWSLEQAGAAREALEAYARSFDVSPMPETALAAGRLCSTLGDPVRAREFLHYVVAHDAGAKATKAKALLEALEPDS